MKVKCDVEEIDMDGDHATVEGVQATCSRCGHQVQAFGTSGRSVRSCLVRMREECPNGECNFYEAGGSDKD